MVRAYIASQLKQLGEVAERAEIPTADLAVWRTQHDPAATDLLVDHPEFYYCEGHFVATAQAP